MVINDREQGGESRHSMSQIINQNQMSNDAAIDSSLCLVNGDPVLPKCDHILKIAIPYRGVADFFPLGGILC